MANWIVRRTVRFTQEVEATTKEEALEAFCEHNARIETLKEVAYKGCFVDIHDDVYRATRSKRGFTIWDAQV